MKRRLLAGLMAGMLVFSSCAPAWAAEGLPGEYETEAASAEDGSEEVPDLAEDQPDGELAADEEASLPDEIPNDPEDLQETGGDAITDGLISDTVSDQDAPTDAIGEAEAAEETESEAAAEETEEMPGIIPDEEDGSPEEAEPETDEEEILEEAPEEAVQMADGDEEDIEYEREWDRNMLPGWDGTVRGSYGVHYRVDDEDIDDWYKVTNVEIVSDKPSEPNRKVIVDFHKDSNENDPDNDYWWYYRAGNYGEATLKVTYQDIKGAEQNYQFTLFVCGDAYSVYMDSNGRERNAFPGGEIGLYADAWHEYIDDNGEQQGESESLKYVWSVTQGAEYAVVTPDAGDPSKATLQFNELPADEDWINEEVVVGVRVQDAEGEDTEAYDETHFWVRSGYTEVWPIDLDMGLDVGGVLEDYEFEVRRYEFGRDGYETIDPEAVRYEWHYDENALAVTETVGGKTHIIPDGESGEGNVFTITRKGDWDTSFSVKASWKEGDDDQEAWGNYRFRNRNCDIWFDEHDCDIYTDAEEMPAILLNVNNLGDNWQERLDLDLIAGHWDNDDWQGDPLTIDDDYTLKPEGDHIAVSLTKEYLDSVKDNDDVRIWAAVYLKNAEHTEDNRLRDTDAWFHIEQARSEYDFDWEEITMLPGWEHFIYRWQNADIYSSRVKGGEWHGDVEVLSVKSEDPAIADVKYNEWDNDEFPDGKDHNWTVRANSFGSTTITLTYKDWDGSEANYDFKVSVSDEQYELHSWIEGDSDISLPGGIINLKADIRHSIYDPKTGEHWDESRDEIAEKVRFAWNIKDDEDSLRWIDHLEYPAGEDGDQAKVYLKDLPDGYNGIWRDLFVEVRAVSVDDPDDVKGYDCQRIVISDSYYEVSVPGFDDDIWQGQEMTVTPELRRYPSRNDGNASGYDVITKDVYFRWEYDDEAVEIKDSAGNIVGNYDKIDTGETDEDGQPIYDYRYRGSELSGVAGTAYTIRKLKNYDTGVRLIIDYINDTGDEDECGWGRNFWEHGTDFWIETPGGNNVFTDGDRTVELNLDNYESAPDDLYELRYEVSAWYPKDDSFNDWEEKPLPEQYFTVSG